MSIPNQCKTDETCVCITEANEPGITAPVRMETGDFCAPKTDGCDALITGVERVVLSESGSCFIINELNKKYRAATPAKKPINKKNPLLLEGMLDGVDVWICTIEFEGGGFTRNG